MDKAEALWRQRCSDAAIRRAVEFMKLQDTLMAHDADADANMAVWLSKTQGATPENYQIYINCVKESYLDPEYDEYRKKSAFGRELRIDVDALPPVPAPPVPAAPGAADPGYEDSLKQAKALLAKCASRACTDGAFNRGRGRGLRVLPSMCFEPVSQHSYRSRPAADAPQPGQQGQRQKGQGREGHQC